MLPRNEGERTGSLVTQPSRTCGARAGSAAETEFAGLRSTLAAGAPGQSARDEVPWAWASPAISACERLDEGRSFFRFELIQGIPHLSFAQLAEMSADLLRGGRGGDQHPPAIGRIGSSNEMTRIDEAIDELGGRRHRTVERGGDLADGHLPARSQLEQHFDLRGRQAMGITETGDSQVEGFGNDRQQLHAGFNQRPFVRIVLIVLHPNSSCCELYPIESLTSRLGGDKVAGRARSRAG